MTLCVLAGWHSIISSATTVCWYISCISARWQRRELAFNVFPHLIHLTSLAFHLAVVTRTHLSRRYDLVGS